MKRLLIVILMLSISLSAKDSKKTIGYDKLNLNLSAEELQRILKTDYSNWSISYIDLKPIVIHDPNREGEDPEAYYKLSNNSGVSITIYLTEGMTGEVCNIYVRESFKNTDVLYKQFYSLQNILTKKYGNPTDTNDNTKGLGFDYDVVTNWTINTTQFVYILGSYCEMLTDDGSRRSCHSIEVGYSDDELIQKRTTWIENRRKEMQTLKYKIDNSKY